MPISSEVLFDQPQREIATRLRGLLSQSTSIQIVSGFATVEGFGALFAQLKASAEKLKTLVVGAGTYRAFELFDELLAAGVPPDRLRVHLGHTRHTSSGATHPFYRYHPMLHSKVYLLELANHVSVAVIGSHNLTGFAMHGLNGEASILLRGPSDCNEMADIRKHVEECVRQSVQYDPAVKEGYTWWTVQFLEGLRDKSNDVPRDSEGQRTIVILAVRGERPLPKKDDVVYFEIPDALGQIQSLRAEVHIYVFPAKPASPTDGLSGLREAVQSYWCRTQGIEQEQGGVELRADWQIVSGTDPRLIPAQKPFRPQVRTGMRQVRARIYNDVRGTFEYLFPERKRSWIPELSTDERVEIPETERHRFSSLQLVPPEDKPWSLVRGLTPAGGDEITKFDQGLRQASPEAGRYILFSMRRRQLRA